MKYPISKNIEAVCNELRKQQPSHHYLTVYNGFQTEKKNPNHMATRFFNCDDTEDACDKLTEFVESLDSGDLTIWAKPNDTLTDTTGKTFYLRVAKTPPSVNGVAAYNPTDLEARIEKRFQEKLDWEREKWKNELEIKELKAQINGLQNAEPEKPDTIGKLVDTGNELLLSLVDKIPAESVGRIFENIFGGISKSIQNGVSEQTLQEIAKLGQLYFATKQAEMSDKDDDEAEIDIS